MLKNPKRIIICEKDEERIRFINENYQDVFTYEIFEGRRDGVIKVAVEMKGCT